MTVGVQH